MNMELNARLVKIGLTTAKSMLIRHLYRNGEMTQMDLCKNLGLDKSTVAKTLTRMEGRGLITKKVNPEDSRSLLVSLTPKAADIYPKTQQIVSDWTNDVMAEMTEPEKETFFRLISMVSEQATKIGGKSAEGGNPQT
jgi:DNA-binding MarR family transcriptional regulator